jgi:hypothetical protein
MTMNKRASIAAGAVIILSWAAAVSAQDWKVSGEFGWFGVGKGAPD